MKKKTNLQFSAHIDDLFNFIREIKRNNMNEVKTILSRAEDKMELLSDILSTPEDKLELLSGTCNLESIFRKAIGRLLTIDDSLVNVDLVKLLLNEAGEGVYRSLDAKDKNGNTLLHLACMRVDGDIINTELLNALFDSGKMHYHKMISAANNTGENPLHIVFENTANNGDAVKEALGIFHTRSLLRLM
jgi:ankyrin repeat protein